MMARWRIIAPTMAVLSVAIALSLMRISCFDVWWHIECGKLLIKDGLIPREEIFSYTAAGRPWVDGYLLAQAVLYIAWLIAGPSGVCIFGAVLVTAAFSLALAMSWWGATWAPRISDSLSVPDRRRGGADKSRHDDDPWRPSGVGYGAALLVSLPAVYATAAVMLPRPALLTPVFGLLTLWILEDYRKHGGKRIWWILLLMVLWANCHPAFLLGPLITGTYFVGAVVHRTPGGIEKGRGNPGMSPWMELALLFIGQLLVVLINPYGYKVYYSALSLLSNPELRNYILEWKPLFGNPPEWPGIIPAFLTVAVIGLVCFAFSWRRTRVEHLLLFIVLAAASVAGRRNRLQFGPMSIALISWTVSNGIHGARRAAPLWRFLQRKLIASSCAIILTLAALSATWFVATDRLFFYVRIFQSTGLGINPNYFPEGAVKIFQREPIKGNLFHDYSLGGYLMFALYPQYKVFIDGRMYPYPIDTLFSEDDALKSGAVFEKLRLKYDVRAVLLHLSQKRTRLMAQALLLSNEWAPVYVGTPGALFLMRGVGNDDIIARYEINVFKNPPPLPAVASGEWYPFNRADYPYSHMWWVGFYDLVGRPDLAAQTLKPVLGIQPPVENVEAWYGALAIDAGELEEGIGILNRVLDKDKENIVATCALAEYWIARKDFARAEEILADIMIRGSATAEFWRAYGQLQYYRGNLQSAAGYFRKALEYRPNDGRMWEKLGMSLEKDDVAGAIDAYRHALALRYATGASPEEMQSIRAQIEKIKQNRH